MFSKNIFYIIKVHLCLLTLKNRYTLPFSKSSISLCSQGHDWGIKDTVAMSSRTAVSLH